MNNSARVRVQVSPDVEDDIRDILHTADDIIAEDYGQAPQSSPKRTPGIRAVGAPIGL